MIIAIHQPNYIPWLGYFYKIYQSDIFVFLNDAQFSNEGMHNYHYLKTPQGPFRLKIPVEKKLGDKIFEVQTKDVLGWKAKHLKTIDHIYSRAPHFKEVFADFSVLLEKEYSNLSEMNIEIISFICKKFKFTTTLYLSSESGINTTKEEKILDLCNFLNANVYYSGTGAKAYQSENNFIKRNIELRYSVYKPFEYSQYHGTFQSNVTILDYLMHCGYDWDRVLKHQLNSYEKKNINYSSAP
jgi:hypothetical protein